MLLVHLFKIKLLNHTDIFNNTTNMKNGENVRSNYVMLTVEYQSVAFLCS